jgi:CBS-domain-containing membrane protein
MPRTTQSLLELKAADIMSRDVITVPQQMSLQAAACLLAQAHVSGAPVVDEYGRCVGVLSATDLVHWVGRGEQAAKRRLDRASRYFCCDWEVVSLKSLPPDAVSRHMTTDLVTAGPDTGITELARWMRDAHIHRIVVTDDQGRPVGIVTSMDVLAAVAAEDPSEPRDPGD